MQLANAWFTKALPKRAIFALLLTAMVPGLQGCTDEEIATGVAIVAIGAAGVAIGAAAGSRDRHHDDYRPGRREEACRMESECREYRDYWGNLQRECREFRRCRGWNGLSLAANVTASLPGSGDAVTADGLARTFALSQGASARFLSALDAARLGKGAQLRELGLDQNELRRLSRYELPSAAAIDNLARNLNQDRVSTESMLRELIGIARERQQEIQQSGGGGA